MLGECEDAAPRQSKSQTALNPSKEGWRVENCMLDCRNTSLIIMIKSLTTPIIFGVKLQAFPKTKDQQLNMIAQHATKAASTWLSVWLAIFSMLSLASVANAANLLNNPAFNAALNSSTDWSTWSYGGGWANYQADASSDPYDPSGSGQSLHGGRRGQRWHLRRRSESNRRGSAECHLHAYS